jgi:hypothetical protein
MGFHAPSGLFGEFFEKLERSCEMTVGKIGVTAACLLAAIGLGLTCRAGAQEAVQQEKRTADVAMMMLPDNDGEGQEARQKVMLELIAADAQVVKGKPYSAEASTETVQTLADGNRIVHRSESKIYRDSDGRTRREQTFGNVDPEHPSPHEVKVFIDNPVNGSAFVLDPGSKSADELQRKQTIFIDRKIRDEGKGTIINDDEAEQEGGGPAHMMVKFREDHASDVLTEVIPDDKRETAKEELGTRNIEGIDCTGTRMTITIPAGAVGNEKPIVIVRETWFAPAIAAVVESTSDDPRYGKTTYQLKNVQLNEPPRSLFEAPADFKTNVRK